jgi:hypothetical protein
MTGRISPIDRLVLEQREEEALRHQNWLERRQPSAVVYPDRDDDVESLALAKVMKERES